MKYFPRALGLLLAPALARAHCPLCTIGAAAAAGGAAALGVSYSAIGVFIGAFAVSVGWWVARIIKKEYIRFQRELIILFSYVTTIWPMTAFLSDIRAWYLSWLGPYGTTIPVDMFIVSSLIGGGVVCITPWLSEKITEWRGKHISYQGMILTLVLLALVGIVMQVMS